MSEFVRAAMRLHILHHAETAPIQSAWMAAELARHGHKLGPDALPSMLYRMHADDLLTPNCRWWTPARAGYMRSPGAGGRC